MGGYVLGSLLVVLVLQAVAIAALLLGGRRPRGQSTLGEREYRRLADGVPAMLWTARADATLDYANTALVDFAGMSLRELRDEGWLDAVHPDDRDRLPEVYVAACEARKPFRAEYRMRRADGVYRWLLSSGVPWYRPDGGLAGYVGCHVDITELREGEERIRASQADLEVSHREVRHLAGRLIESQDAERARIARDLHDDVSQELAGLSISLSALKRRMAELHVRGLQADLRAIHERTVRLAQSVRHLSHDLHPTVLRHVGLAHALESHCAELERAHGAVLTCSTEKGPASLAPDVSLCLYRIAQEALRNVVAHAGASRAEVRLAVVGGDTELTIADDGKGFSVSDALERGKGLGLVSICERARLAGGTASITSDAGNGTRVSVRIPGALTRTEHDMDVLLGEESLT